jgi:hypothetical protein
MAVIALWMSATSSGKPWKKPRKKAGAQYIMMSGSGMAGELLSIIMERAAPKEYRF